MFINCLLYFFVFLLGLCIGSFLNCVIYRLEEEKTLAGRSFCPHCKHILAWKDLAPVFSFLFLAGKCRYCRKKISVQYPLVEFATGLLFVFILWKLGAGQALAIGFWDLLNFGFLLYIASALIAIFVYDLKHYLIPDKVLFPAIVISAIYKLAMAEWGVILAILVGAGFFFAIWFISGGKWMGFGDVKLAILMGLLLGWPNILCALFLAFAFGAIIGLILMVFQKKGLKSELPFGPFLVLGTFIALFWGQPIINWYLGKFLL